VVGKGRRAPAEAARVVDVTVVRGGARGGRVGGGARGEKQRERERAAEEHGFYAADM
jgi:hypothetical protein